MSSASGRLIGGRYRIAEALGRGGMGAVWRARDEVLARDVAVKELVFPPGLTSQDQELMRGRTMREARTAARLSHPGVVRIYDVVEEEQRPWIVMELLPSARSLSQILADEGALSPHRAAKIGMDVLAGLAAAHSAGVLHRDVKPGNILIAMDGRAVLGDFGIAVAEEEPTLTRSGVLIGSPAYLSPEQARGKDLTPASDLWSLGATLYTIVEGHTPFHRDNIMATLTAIIVDAPDPPRRAGPLWPVIEGLLRKEPGDRLDTAAVAARLVEVATEPTVQTSSPAPATTGDTEPAERTAVLHKPPVGRPERPATPAVEPPAGAEAGGPPSAPEPAPEPAAAPGAAPAAAGRAAHEPDAESAAADASPSRPGREPAPADGSAPEPAAEPPSSEGAAEADAAARPDAGADHSARPRGEARAAGGPARADRAARSQRETGAPEPPAAHRPAPPQDETRAPNRPDAHRAAPPQPESHVPEPPDADAHRAARPVPETHATDRPATGAEAEGGAGPGGEVKAAGRAVPERDARADSADRDPSGPGGAPASDEPAAAEPAAEPGVEPAAAERAGGAPGAGPAPVEERNGEPVTRPAAAEQGTGDRGTAEQGTAEQGTAEQGARPASAGRPAAESAAEGGSAAGSPAAGSPVAAGTGSARAAVAPPAGAPPVVAPSSTGAARGRRSGGASGRARAASATPGSGRAGHGSAGVAAPDDRLGAAPGSAGADAGYGGSPVRDAGSPGGVPAGPTRPGRRVTRRRRVVAGVAAVALAAGAVVLTVDLLSDHPRHRATVTGSRGATPRSGGASHAPATKPSGGAGTSRAATPSPTAPAPGGPASTAVPAGFRRYQDRTGFSIAVPDGWRISRDGHYVYVREPHGGRYLLIDQTTDPKPDPLADWRGQDAYRRDNDTGYHRIALRTVPGYFEKSADLEFTHGASGDRTHVLNRNILVNDHRAYALYWSTPEAEWQASRHYFDVFAATFRPAS